ncbi:MAG: 2-isopropylmalate synthase [Oceanococcus sp.]
MNQLNSSAAGDDRLIIFDTTLRDGEQSPGASMTKDEKVRIARALERLKVDVIEAGFAIASPGDFEAVKAVASAVKESIVCSLARTSPQDIERAAEALKPAVRGRIHTFIATSPIHMQEKLRMQPDDVVAAAVGAVKLARQFTDDVEFSPEDAGRSEPDFLHRIIEAVIDAGATTINVPDTVGYTLPHMFGELIRNMRNAIPNADKAIFSVHCHNDLGLAVANSLAAVQNGARQVECTINGLGERAGNAALEEVAMAVRTRRDQFSCDHGLDTQHIMACSRLVSGVTGFPVQPNKAIVGANAFAHESGIHQDGVIKSRETYEIMRAEDVGWSAQHIVLGKHSGRNAFKTRCVELGIQFSGQAELDNAFKRFKILADKKHEIFDEDLHALVSDVAQAADRIVFESLQYCASSDSAPKVDLSLQIDGEIRQVEATGDGSVDAVFRAIELLVSSGCDMRLFSVNAITQGTDAQGEVTVRLARNGRIVNGQGADTDVIVASAKAYVHALNGLEKIEQRVHPQVGDAV